MSYSKATSSSLAQASILLASASPRRQELLEQLGLQFLVASQDIDESQYSGEEAMDYVTRMAREKAESARSNSAPDSQWLIIAADTVVVSEGEVLGKPKDQADAQRMLLKLAGAEHRVLTAVTMVTLGAQRSTVSESRVLFRQISPGEAADYWHSGEPIGKAGGYAIQGLGAVFVQHLEGSYSSVMGLPLFETSQLLNEFGIAVLPPASQIKDSS